MRLSELIGRLTEIQEELGDDVEVRLMTQESWPFENVFLGVTTSEEMKEVRDSIIEDYDDECSEDDGESVVFLVEGGQIAYGSKLAWRAVRGG